MTATIPPLTRTNGEPPKAPASRWGPSLIDRVLTPAGEMGVLLGVVVWSAVRHPVSYWGEVRDQVFSMLKLYWIPMAISTVTFGFGSSRPAGRQPLQPLRHPHAPRLLLHHGLACYLGAAAMTVVALLAVV